MSDVTVAQFAEVLKVPVDRLLVQLESAGIQVAGPQALISDEAKLDDGAMWPTSFALKEWTPAEEARIAGLLKKALG